MYIYIFIYTYIYIYIYSYIYIYICIYVHRAGPHGNEHGSSIMYIVYDSLQAAPDYLITYVWRDDMDLDSD